MFAALSDASGFGYGPDPYFFGWLDPDTVSPFISVVFGFGKKFKILKSVNTRYQKKVKIVS